jgi:hypothetical protein
MSACVENADEEDLPTTTRENQKINEDDGAMDMDG